MTSNHPNINTWSLSFIVISHKEYYQQFINKGELQGNKKTCSKSQAITKTTASQPSQLTELNSIEQTFMKPQSMFTVYNCILEISSRTARSFCCKTVSMVKNTYWAGIVVGVTGRICGFWKRREKKAAGVSKSCSFMTVTLHFKWKHKGEWNTVCFRMQAEMELAHWVWCQETLHLFWVSDLFQALCKRKGSNFL